MDSESSSVGESHTHATRLTIHRIGHSSLKCYCGGHSRFSFVGAIEANHSRRFAERLTADRRGKNAPKELRFGYGPDLRQCD
jgi:hypothetical protein